LVEQRAFNPRVVGSNPTWLVRKNKMFVYKNIETGQFVISQTEMNGLNWTFIKKAREIRINAEEVCCNMYFISEDNHENDIFVIT
jgi:hypothetical protein